MKYFTSLMMLTFFGITLQLNAQNSPVVTLGNITTLDSSALVSVTVADFKNILSCDLKIKYDSSITIAKSIKLNEEIGGNFNTNIVVPGEINFAWYTSYSAVTLADSSELFNILFEKISSGTSSLRFDVSEEYDFCRFYNDAYQLLNDEPVDSFYIPGFVTFHGSEIPEKSKPVITVDTIIDPLTCGGNGTVLLLIAHVPDASYDIKYDYDTITDVLVVDGRATLTLPAGTYNNLQMTVGDSTSDLGVNVSLFEPESPSRPFITVNGPTEFCEGGSVDLSTGEADAYQWSTGDTTQTINVSETGSYNVTVFNLADCSSTSETIEIKVNPKPTEPIKNNCWDEFVFNDTICDWLNVGSKPAEPEVECWETATWNDTICNWKIEGIKPTIPDAQNCWDEFVFNDTICEWVNVGSKPIQPEVECWETAIWNDTTCNWEIAGSKPIVPHTQNCWDKFVFNDTICEWENVGSKPTQPEVECWETANWNDTTCNWEITGIKPTIPDAQYCWDEFVFNDTICDWVNVGSKPAEPEAEHSWDEFLFLLDSCIWKNIGIPTDVSVSNHVYDLILASFPNPFNKKVSIYYILPEDGFVEMDVIGILGTRINLIARKCQQRGEYTYEFNGDNLVAGVYQINMRFVNYEGKNTRKIIRLIKY